MEQVGATLELGECVCASVLNVFSRGLRLMAFADVRVAGLRDEQHKLDLRELSESADEAARHVSRLGFPPRSAGAGAGEPPTELIGREQQCQELTTR